jgi:hypothetical protein
MIGKIAFAALFISFSTAPQASAAPTTLGVRCGANEDRVWVYESLVDFNVQAKLKCGEQVEILDRVKGYVKIRTAKGDEGFVNDTAFPKSAIPPEPEDHTHDLEAQSQKMLAAAKARGNTSVDAPTVAAAPAPAAVPAPAPAPVVVAKSAPAASAPAPAVVASRPAPPTVTTAPAARPTVAVEQPAPAPVKPVVVAAAPVATPTPAPAVVAVASRPAPPTVAVKAAPVAAPKPAPVAAAPAPVVAAAPAAREMEVTLTTAPEPTPSAAPAPVAAAPVAAPAPVAVTRTPVVAAAKPAPAPVDPDADIVETTPTESIAGCNSFFAAYGLSPNQFKWLEQNRKKAFPTVCPAPTQAMVDYIVIFTHDVDFYSVTMPTPVHHEKNGFSDWAPLSTVDTALMSDANKSHHEYVWVFHSRRGTYDPAAFSAHRRPLFSKDETNILGSHGGFHTVMDALTWIETNGGPR